MSISISLITIVNKNDVYEGFLKSLGEQKNITYELIPVYNIDNEFSSARVAYNQAVQKAQGRYLCFVHPDIRFLDENSLHDFLEYVISIDDFGVVGIAGAVACGKKSRDILTTIVQGEKLEKVGCLINKPEKIQTVDECFFVIKKEYFQKNHFSIKEGWHLYSVEYCLQALKKNKQNYVVPSRIWHMSDGKSLDSNYITQLNILIEEFRNDYELICTTVKAWPTKGIGAYLYRKYYWLKQYIKRIIRGKNNAVF